MLVVVGYWALFQNFHDHNSIRVLIYKVYEGLITELTFPFLRFVWKAYTGSKTTWDKVSAWNPPHPAHTFDPWFTFHYTQLVLNHCPVPPKTALKHHAPISKPYYYYKPHSVWDF